MDFVRNICSALFGYALLGLSLMVVVDIVSRKLLGFSLQGTDELGGYVLAIGSTLAFSVALIGQGHIRVDILRGVLPRTARAVLDWLSAVLMAALAALLTWVSYLMLSDSISYGSIAPTPWGTPLAMPQGAWFIGMVMLLLVALWLALCASILFFSGRHERLVKDFGPTRVSEEISEEFNDLQRR